MAKKKNNIDFIAAQKAISSVGHGPKFEVILVAVVVVVAAVMITWYVLTNKKYQTASQNITTLEDTLEEKKVELTIQQKKFNSYYVCDGKDGRTYQVVGHNSDGSSIYKTVSITDIASQYASAVANAQATATEVKGVVDLTSTALNMVFESAYNSNNTITSFSISGVYITINLEAESNDDMKTYYQFFCGNGNLYSGCDPTDYFAEASIKSQIENADGSYTYSLTLTLINDNLYAE